MTVAENMRGSEFGATLNAYVVAASGRVEQPRERQMDDSVDFRGIWAKCEIPVHRREVYEAIRRSAEGSA